MREETSMSAPFEKFDVERTQDGGVKVIFEPEAFIGIEKTHWERLYFVQESIQEKLRREK